MRRLAEFCVIVTMMGITASPLIAQNQSLRQIPFWIWSARQAPGEVPIGSCFFRKQFFVQDPQEGQVEVFADNRYEVYLNGTRIGDGSGWQSSNSHDLSEHFRSGKNLLAFSVENDEGNTAGLAATLTLNTKSGESRVYVTNSTWKTNLHTLPLWHNMLYKDGRWDRAKTLGRWGTTQPWIQSGTTASSVASAEKGREKPPQGRITEPEADRPVESSQIKERPKSTRFSVREGFRLERVTNSKQTGSLIAMTITEFGNILAAVENGPLLRIHDTNGNGIPDSVSTCCEKVTNCQGLVAISGDAIVTGAGPTGAGVYRLIDQDRDGRFETAKKLLGFEDSMSEHGPHGMVLGPDGMLYISVGSQAALSIPLEPSSPLVDFYQGDLIEPRFEDPNGHADGVRGYGGGVLRMKTDGKHVELFAGGIRNAYDLAFTRDGELLVHDSDMEADQGLPWHRPTRLLHVIAGSEFGWRSGWAKWPDYYIDSLPSVLDTGRGSPAGLVLYDHDQFPSEYHGALFSCDWARGEILAVKIDHGGAGMTADVQVMVRGQPLNVTDIAVGVDGSVYFCTGGRGARGEILRLVSTREIGERAESRENKVAQLIRESPPRYSWGRQTAAKNRAELGTEWDDEIRALVRDFGQPADLRADALQLMHFVGPPPTDEQLLALSQDSDPSFRGWVTYYLGLVSNDATRERLVELMKDSHPLVRRRACEALQRCGHSPSWSQIAPLLVSADRFEAWSARRLLQQAQPDGWLMEILRTDSQPHFTRGAIAGLIARPTRAFAIQAVERAETLAERYVSDNDFVEMLRLVSLAVVRGELQSEDVPSLASWLASEYPAEDDRMNRELVRVLVALRSPLIIEPALEFLDSNSPRDEKIHAAMHLVFLKQGWTLDQRRRLLKFLDGAEDHAGGANLQPYLRNARNTFVNNISPST